MRALAWWGSAYLLGGFAVALWTVEYRMSPPVPVGLPNAVLFVACGMIWNAARIFHGRRVLWGGILAGPSVWLAACMSLDALELAAARLLLSSLLVSIYTLLTATELWRERRKTVLHCWPAVLVPILHAAVFLAPMTLAIVMPVDGSSTGFASGWFALFGLEIMLYVVGSPFIILVLAKERTLRLHQDAAFTDELTGVLNRRGFFAAAERMVSQHKRRMPLSVLIFNLDHFKSINDRFGHAMGDETLRLFATTASNTLRATDVRFGGEEFVVMLPGSLPEATAAAERDRDAFERVGATVAGCVLGATVSIGAASASIYADIPTLLTAADRALYRAKANGRNRIAGIEAAAGTSIADRGTPSSGRKAGAELAEWTRNSSFRLRKGIFSRRTRRLPAARTKRRGACAPLLSHLCLCRIRPSSTFRIPRGAVCARTGSPRSSSIRCSCR
ncbi:MAG: GGDEF domain-containing protein [Xanthobacteraceae bacterium]